MRVHQGQRVRCVNPSGRPLKRGHVYTVDCVYGEWCGLQMIYLEGIVDLTPFRADRFAPIVEEQNVG